MHCISKLSHRLPAFPSNTPTFEVMTDQIRRKLVIIGDGACGKTSLLSVFTLGYFPTVSSPSNCSYIDLPADILFLALRESHSMSRTLNIQLMSSAGPHSIRKLCHGLQSGWKVSSVGSMGYGRSRRLRATPTTCICEGTRYSHRLFYRHPRFSG